MALYKGEIELFRKILQRERQKIKTNDKEKVHILTLYELNYLLFS